MAKRAKRTGPTVQAMRDAIAPLTERAEISAVVLAVRVQTSDHEWATETICDGDLPLIDRMLEDACEAIFPDPDPAPQEKEDE